MLAMEVTAPFLLRSDNGLVFTSRSYTALVRSYGLRQEFITPHGPEQNGMVERVVRTLKEQCVHRHCFESWRLPAGSLPTGLASTTTGVHIRRYVSKHPLRHLHKRLELSGNRRVITAQQYA